MSFASGEELAVDEVDEVGGAEGVGAQADQGVLVVGGGHVHQVAKVDVKVLQHGGLPLGGALPCVLGGLRDQH